MAVSDNDQSVTGQQEVTNGMRVSRDSTHTDNVTLMRPSGTEMNNLVTLDDYLEIREQLSSSDNKVEQLQQSNFELMR